MLSPCEKCLDLFDCVYASAVAVDDDFACIYVDIYAYLYVGCTFAMIFKQKFDF